MVADVAGKGIPAALLMSISRPPSAASPSMPTSAGLAETLGRLNELVFHATPANRFITMFAPIYEPGSQTLRYASAGHNPAAFLPAGTDQVEWIRTRA
jgi:sigma-B regulation protein RsbU (phosphoserine phosphatase)